MGKRLVLTMLVLAVAGALLSRAEAAEARKAVKTRAARATQQTMKANLMPNPSLEAGDNAPQGWKFTGPPGQEAKSWARENAHSGSRCIAFYPELEDAAWECAPIRVKAGKPYGLTWWTRIDGERPGHWAYRVKFSGVILRFLDKKGAEISRIERQINAFQTEGWAQAWVKVKPPKGAQALTVAFAYRTGIKTDGQVRVDDVELQSLAPLPPVAKGFARLILRATDSAHKPIAARMWAKTAEGQYAFPKYSYQYDVPDTGFHAAPEDCWIDVPAGEVTVGARCGFEFAPAQRTVKLTAGKTRRATLVLKRTVDMPALGWFAVDHHSHLFFHKHTRQPAMQPRDSFAIARAEGLNYLAFDGESNEFRADMDQVPAGADDKFYGEMSREATRDLFGHLPFIGLRRDNPNATRTAGDLWPTNDAIEARVIEQGGAMVYGHPLKGVGLDKLFAVMSGKEKGGMARGIVMDVLFGRQIGYDVYSHITPPQRLSDMLTVYYNLLNLGRKVAMTAATDYYIDQGRSTQGCPGAWRTYVRANKLDPPSIAEAYREARTVATNAPVVLLTVGGAAPGDETKLDKPGEIEVSLRAFSQWGLEAAELVVNGKVVRRWQAQDGRIEVKERVPVSETSWVAARVFGPKVPQVDASPMSCEPGEFCGQFAHTSPIFARVAGADFRPRRQAVEFCLEWLGTTAKGVEALRDEYLSVGTLGPGLTGAEAYERVQARIAEARRIAEQMLGNAVE